MENIKISIVTICFNNAAVIEATLTSVLEQSYAHIEYLVVDGGSSDGTLAVVDRYRDKIARVINGPDKGLYDAINKGLQAASGEVVGLIHGGDRLYDKDTLARIAHLFQQKQPDVIYGHSVMVDEQGRAVRVNRSPVFRRWRIPLGWMPSHQSIYLRRELLDSLGYYRLELHPGADYEFFLRYFYFNRLKIERLNAYVLRFAIGGRSTRDYRNNLRAQKQHRDCWRANGGRPPFYLVPCKLLRKPVQFVRAALWRGRGALPKNQNQVYGIVD